MDAGLAEATCLARGIRSRFQALAWAESYDQHWELALPVSITDNARA